MNLVEMTRRGLQGQSATRQEALEVLHSSDDELLSVVAAAGRIRRRFFANRVRLNYLVNLKSGLCPEDCSYCSQHLGSLADIMTYSWASSEDIRDAVEAGIRGGAGRICLVASGHGPSSREVERVTETVRQIKAEHCGVEVCVCLGFVDGDKAARLSASGADAYNHNANTARSHYPDICSTHSYDDRMATIDIVRRNGLSPCSGIIAGMGESDEELVDVLTDLRTHGVESVPINFLLPFEGTPLAGTGDDLSPQRCLRILAAARFIHPDVEVRAAAGRERHIRTLQPLTLEIVNSIFLGDYLTSEGTAGAADLAMIRDGGFVLEGAGGVAAPVPDPSSPQQGVPIRRRGIGTPLPANA